MRIQSTSLIESNLNCVYILVVVSFHILTLLGTSILLGIIIHNQISLPLS